jgi:methylenetetrahydrofolate dehydrogenase (NADP+) / methenyltetrahydrofolate cyclohydrolase
MAIDPAKDVDGFHPVNVGRLSIGDETVLAPCTPAGIIEMLLRSGYDPSGKHVVVVGRSNIVGKPVALLLLRTGRGGNATVTIAHSRTPTWAPSRGRRTSSSQPSAARTSSRVTW